MVDQRPISMVIAATEMELAMEARKEEELLLRTMIQSMRWLVMLLLRIDGMGLILMECLKHNNHQISE